MLSLWCADEFWLTFAKSSDDCRHTQIKLQILLHKIWNQEDSMMSNYLRLKNSIRLIMCPVERAIIRKPAFPCSPPIGAWTKVAIQWNEAIIPVINVINDTHQRIRVTGLFDLWNLVNQLWWPKCRKIWYAAMQKNNIPTMMWIHTDVRPLLWVASSCMPDINITIVRNSSPRSHSLSLAIFFMCKFNDYVCVNVMWRGKTVTSREMICFQERCVGQTPEASWRWSKEDEWIRKNSQDAKRCW